MMEAALATRVIGLTVHQQLESKFLTYDLQVLDVMGSIPCAVTLTVMGLSPALGPGMFSAGTKGL